MKKLLTTFSLLGASATLTLSAAYDDQQRPAGRISDDDQQQMREITPNAGPRVASGADLFITADFIYWTAREDGLGYVMSGFGSTTNPPSKGSIRHIDWNFDPGFKVGLGLNFEHDGWDIYAQYTWLNPSSETRRTSGTFFYPTWNISNAFNSPSFNPNDQIIVSARALWDINFQLIDLELGRNYYISQYLTLRPHVGFKGTWQDEHYHVTYRPQEPTSTNQVRRMKNDQDYWGFGIRTGLDTAWHFGYGFSLFGDFAISALWSQFQVERRDTNQSLLTVNAPEITIFNTENDFHTILPVVEFIIGLRWETWFSDDDYHFAIQAGWEEQIWFEYNQHIHLYEESAHGDLILQGLTVGIRFGF